MTEDIQEFSAPNEATGMTLAEAAEKLGSDPEPAKETPREEEGYISRSTVDHPPLIPDEVDDNEDFRKPRGSDMYVGERLFEIEFAVTLKPAGGKAIKVPLLVEDSIRGTIVEDALPLALSDRRNVQIIQAILDNPKDRMRIGDAHPDAGNKQGSMF